MRLLERGSGGKRRREHPGDRGPQRAHRDVHALRRPVNRGVDARRHRRGRRRGGHDGRRADAHHRPRDPEEARQLREVRAVDTALTKPRHHVERLRARRHAIGLLPVSHGPPRDAEHAGPVVLRGALGGPDLRQEPTEHHGVRVAPHDLEPRFTSLGFTRRLERVHATHKKRASCAPHSPSAR